MTVNTHPWLAYEGMLLHKSSRTILTPFDYGAPIFYEDLSELCFTHCDAVIFMSEVRFNVFFQDYQAIRQLCAPRKIKMADGRFADLENTLLHHPDCSIELADCTIHADIDGLRLNHDPMLLLDYDTVEVLRIYRLVNLLSSCAELMQPSLSKTSLHHEHCAEK